MSFFNRSNGLGAAASSLPASSSILSTRANPLAQQFIMPDGSTKTLKTADATYWATAVPVEVPVDVPGPAQGAQGAYADTVAPGFLEQAGMWIWVVPAGLAAAGIVYFFVKHRKSSVSGYRRRRSRSRR